MCGPQCVNIKKQCGFISSKKKYPLVATIRCDRAKLGIIPSKRRLSLARFLVDAAHLRLLLAVF